TVFLARMRAPAGTKMVHFHALTPVPVMTGSERRIVVDLRDACNGGMHLFRASKRGAALMQRVSVQEQ
ncbi:hypothetical protein, partial [Paraburkholderia sp.]|uniref:hypothetical protein n=1 Tax=Paraburkholderia sp. TaxID=1926495 RepID=UPI002F40DDCF